MMTQTLTENGLPVEAQPWARKVDRFMRDEETKQQMLARTGNQALIAAGTAITAAANSEAAQLARLAEERRIPAALDATAVVITPSAYFDPSGTPHGRIEALVAPGDLDVDGNPLIPTSYQMWGRVLYVDGSLEPGDKTTIGLGPNYQLLAESPTTDLRADGLQVGVTYQCRFTSVTGFGVSGTLSDWVSATPPATLEAMAAPSAPTLSTGSGMLVVNWDGLFGVSQPPSQFRFVFALVSVAGMNVWERKGASLTRGGGGIQISEVTKDVAYDVALVGVDSQGEETEPSGVATITIVGIEQAELSDELITIIGTTGNAITFSIDPPFLPGATIGDTWFQHSTGNSILGQWAWSGTAWVPQTISHQVIASIDLATATVGTLHGDYITAKSIGVEQLKAGSIGVNELHPSVGADIDLSVNGTFTVIAGLQSELAASLAGTQSRFKFSAADGLEVTDPAQPMSLALKAGEVQIRNNGAVVSRWNAGQLFVDSLIGREVVLGAHKIEFRAGTTNQTVVRALGTV